MTEWAGNAISAANVKRRIVASKREMDFCQAKAGISDGVSPGNRALAAGARALVRNWWPSISLNSPEKSAAKTTVVAGGRT
jgi:hypothetical protein